MTWMSLILGAGVPRTARSTLCCAICSRGVVRPPSPRAAIDFKILRRFISVKLSECVLRRKLENPGRTRALDQSESRRCLPAYGSVEIGVVEHIEELEAQLKPMLLPDLEDPGQIRIGVEIPRTDERVVP